MNKGFTLVEIIIVLAVFSGIVLMVSFLTLDISSFSLFFGENLSVQQELQLSLVPMVSEVRSMGRSSTGSYPIASAAANSLIFYSDIDNDGLFEKMRYFMDGDIFKKGVIKPTGSPLTYDPTQESVYELVHYVTNFSSIFKYYDESFTGTQVPLSFPIDVSAIRTMKASLTVDRNPNVLPGPFDFSVTASPRNIDDN